MVVFWKGLSHCRSLCEALEVKKALELERNLSLQDNIFFGAMPSENLYNSLYLLPFEVLPINQLFNSSLKTVFIILFMVYNYSFSISILIVRPFPVFP